MSLAVGIQGKSETCFRVCMQYNDCLVLGWNSSRPPTFVKTREIALLELFCGPWLRGAFYSVCFVDLRSVDSKSLAALAFLSALGTSEALLTYCADLDAPDGLYYVNPLDDATAQMTYPPTRPPVRMRNLLETID